MSRSSGTPRGALALASAFSLWTLLGFPPRLVLVFCCFPLPAVCIHIVAISLSAVCVLLSLELSILMSTQAPDE